MAMAMAMAMASPLNRPSLCLYHRGGGREKGRKMVSLPIVLPLALINYSNLYSSFVPFEAKNSQIKDTGAQAQGNRELRHLSSFQNCFKEEEKNQNPRKRKKQETIWKLILSFPIESFLIFLYWSPDCT